MISIEQRRLQLRESDPALYLYIMHVEVTNVLTAAMSSRSGALAEQMTTLKNIHQCAARTARGGG